VSASISALYDNPSKNVVKTPIKQKTDRLIESKGDRNTQNLTEGKITD
jgi:hypothetical protein